MLATPPEQPAPLPQAGPPAETPISRDTPVPTRETAAQPTAEETATPRREETPAAERTPFDPAQDTVTPPREDAPAAERTPFDPPQNTATPRQEAPAAERSPFDPAEDTATPRRDEAPTPERTPFDPAEETATPRRDQAPSERNPFDSAEDTAAPTRDQAPSERNPFDSAEDTAAPTRDQAPAERNPFDPAEDTATPARDEAPAAERTPFDPPEDTATPTREDAVPERDRPVVDEPYIADLDFRTHDRADFDALGEDQLASGIVDERTGRLTHEHEFLEALQMRDLDAALRHMTDNGAYAVHSYTSSAVFDVINDALRTGRNLDEVMPMVRALVSGLNEMPRYEGETVRRVNVRGEAAAIVASRYEVDAVVVESQFLSSSRSDMGAAMWPGDVEMIIEGKTGRYIESLASNKAEHEVLYKPGTQLVVKEKIEIETPHGGKKWVIRLEEITPDDPRYLPPDAAKQQMDRNREVADVQAAEIHAASQREFARAFGGEAAAADVPAKSDSDTTSKPPQEAPKPPKIGEPANGWGGIRRSSDVVGEPAIHARSTDPVDPRAQATGPTPLTRNAHQEVRFLREHLPEIADVNTRGYYADAMPEAYRTNSAESVLAFELRMEGIQAEAQPGRPDDPRGRDFLARQLGGEFHQLPDYNSVVREMAGQPVGSRAVLSVDTPDGQRAFSVVNTEHGVALVDPMTSRLADLPPNPSGVHLMQTHSGDGTPLSRKSEPAPSTTPEPPVSRISELLGAGPERTDPVWNPAAGDALRNRLDGVPAQPGSATPVRPDEAPGSHPHQQPPPHQGGPYQQQGQFGPPQQAPVHNPYQQGQHQQPVHNPYQQQGQFGPPQHTPVHNPYQQPAPTQPNQAGPAPVHQQHGQFGPPQQAPVHNPYQQQAPVQSQPGPLVQQGVPLLQNQPAPWSNMAGATPLHQLPAIHAGTVGPNERAYVAARHPELPNVNPNRVLPNAVDMGYWHNCTRCVVAYAQRLIGIDAQADPVLPKDLAAFDRMKWLEDQLGAKWVHGVGSYDNAIARVANMPHGSHNVIYVSYQQPDGSHQAHVALAVNTPEGVVFIDPQNGGLMRLPTNPTSVSLLPFGSLATSNGLAANPQFALPYGTQQAPNAPGPQTLNLQAPNTPGPAPQTVNLQAPNTQAPNPQVPDTPVQQTPQVPDTPVQQIPQLQDTPMTPLQHGSATPTTPIILGPFMPVEPPVHDGGTPDGHDTLELQRDQASQADAPADRDGTPEEAAPRDETTRRDETPEEQSPRDDTPREPEPRNDRRDTLRDGIPEARDTLPDARQDDTPQAPAPRDETPQARDTLPDTRQDDAPEAPAPRDEAPQARDTTPDAASRQDDTPLAPAPRDETPQARDTLPDTRQDDAPKAPAPRDDTAEPRDVTSNEPVPRDDTAEAPTSRDETPADPDEPAPRDENPDDHRAADDTADRGADDLRPGEDTVVVNGQTMRVDDAFQRLLDEHPELRDAVDNNPGFRRLLLTNLGILVNLITYPDAIPVVEEAWDERLPMPKFPDHVEADFRPPAEHQPPPERPQQPGFPPAGGSFPPAGGSFPPGGIGDQLLPGFDPSRASDPAYTDAYLRDQLERAAAARRELDSALGGIANAVGGTALPATSPGWDELQRNLAGFDGDASRLSGLASAGMQVGSADDAYRAAAQLAGTPGMEVLATEDRLAQGGGLDMQVRTSDGTVGAVSMMPPMPGMAGPGAAGGTARGGRHRKLDGPQQPLVEEAVEVPTPQYFKCFNKTYRVDRDGDGNLTGFLLNVRTGQFEENSTHLEKVLQDELPSNFRSLTEAEFIAETERERAFYLRGEGPLFALYATVDGMRKQAKEEGRALTAQEESFIESVQRRTFGMWEAQPAGFPCTSILA
ncbi:toxin glutamine deamidase domain-containing protein [Amycolatopsis sp. ATCC 39116]|uniref:toxin glutamine deamidase domain-containing protein n=1 Tax=Amycolatopsis sp. (strain ATCC 39116 / 75iv2) TaxID=385957 RepID=UPI000371C949|nr:toxin glutamine deamidase domain-containing protein [Amycolatopsis sp. ATCC 39116]